MKQLFTYILLLFFTTSAQGQQTAINYYPLANCPEKSGFGVLSTALIGSTEFAITDICFVESAGIIYAPEAVGPWTLTSEDQYNSSYQIVENEVASRSQTRMVLSHESHGASYLQTIDEVVFTAGRSHQSIFGSGKFSGLYGYLYDSRFVGTSAGANFVLDIGFVLSSEISDTQGMPVLGVLARSKFNSGSQDAVLTTLDGGAYAKDIGSNAFFRISSNGELQGGGSFLFQSGKLAGFQPFDWRSLRLDISAFKGAIIGTDGDRLRGIAILHGSYLRTDGLTVKLSGYAFIQGWVEN